MISQQEVAAGRPAARPLFGTVVVGASEPEAARDAAALAYDLAGPGCALVVAALAVDPFADPRVGPAPDDARRERAAHTAEVVRAELLSRGQDCTVETDVRAAGSVGAGLRDAAHDHHADLVVVGSSRRGALSRIVGVNGVRAALDRAPCTLAVAPCGYGQQPRALRRVGAAWDHTPPGDAAVGLGRRIADAHAAGLRVMRVVPEGPQAMDPLHHGQERRFRVALARDRMTDLGLPGVDVEVRESHSVVAALADFAEGLDLLVVGAAMREGHLHGGRTVHGLLRHLGCALVVTPARAD
jgi:nucleotide-binding universal stress UspA family protein